MTTDDVAIAAQKTEKENIINQIKAKVFHASCKGELT